MNFKSLCILFLLIPLVAHSQWKDGDIIPPTPVDGDSIFLKIMEYRPEALKTGIESAFYAILDVDSLGNTSNLNFDPIFQKALLKIDYFLISYVRTKLETVKWLPASYKGKKINSRVKIPFIFKLTKTVSLGKSHHEPSMNDINSITFELKPVLFREDALIPTE